MCNKIRALHVEAPYREWGGGRIREGKERGRPGYFVEGLEFLVTPLYMSFCNVYCLLLCYIVSMKISIISVEYVRSRLTKSTESCLLLLQHRCINQCCILLVHSHSTVDMLSCMLLNMTFYPVVFNTLFNCSSYC